MPVLTFHTVCNSFRTLLSQPHIFMLTKTNIFAV